MKISIQGYRGSFHHEVAESLFSQIDSLLERDTFAEVFKDTAEGKADFGIVAVANSSFGGLPRNYDLLLQEDVFVVKEIFLKIHQQLIVIPGTKISDIKKVCSHSVALGQCEKFLSQHPDWEVIKTSDTAGSVKQMAEDGKKEVASIAGKFAAKLYGMEILKENIETYKDNCTRFFVISRKPEYSPKADKTSLAFIGAHVPGALAQILEVFARHKVNLSLIQSRPIMVKGKWTYYFYMDFDESLENEKTKKVFAELKEKKLWTLKKILGSYESGTV